MIMVKGYGIIVLEIPYYVLMHFGSKQLAVITMSEGLTRREREERDIVPSLMDNDLCMQGGGREVGTDGHLTTLDCPWRRG